MLRRAKNPPRRARYFSGWAQAGQGKIEKQGEKVGKNQAERKLEVVGPITAKEEITTLTGREGALRLAPINVPRLTALAQGRFPAEICCGRWEELVPPVPSEVEGSLVEGNPHGRGLGRPSQTPVGQFFLLVMMPLLQLAFPPGRRGSIGERFIPDQGHRFMPLGVSRALARSVIPDTLPQVSGNAAVVTAIAAEEQVTAPTSGKVLRLVALAQDRFPPEIWCGRWDSNPHAFRHRPLKTACLPVPPLPHSKRF